MKRKTEKYSVVYSFNGRWEKSLVRKKVKVFFRKRRPVLPPDRVFFYVGVPVKKIIGFSDLNFIEKVGLDEAIKCKDEGCITEAELERYIGPDGYVFAIHLKEAIIFENPMDFESLRNEFSFNPPQSFSNLSANFERRLVENR